MDECQLARRARVLAFGAAFVAATAAFGSARPAAAAFQFHKIVDNTTLIPNGGGAHFEVRGAPAVGDGWVAFENNDLTIWRATTTGTQLCKSSLPPPSFLAVSARSSNTSPTTCR